MDVLKIYKVDDSSLASEPHHIDVVHVLHRALPQYCCTTAACAPEHARLSPVYLYHFVPGSS